MQQPDLNWIANFIWGIADDVLRDLYVRGKYRDIILPMAIDEPHDRERAEKAGRTRYQSHTRPRFSRSAVAQPAMEYAGTGGGGVFSIEQVAVKSLLYLPLVWRVE